MKILKEPAIEYLLRKAFKEEVNEHSKKMLKYPPTILTFDYLENEYHRWLLHHEFISQDEFDFLQIKFKESE